MLPLTLLLALHVAPETPGIEYRQPQLASSRDLVGLTFGSGNAIWFSGSTDNGKTFSRPVRVAEQGKLALGRHRGPRIAVDGDTIVITAITSDPAATHGPGHMVASGDLYAWRSTDRGRSWSKAVPVSDVPASAREGLHGLAAGKGLLMTVWLDLRAGGTRLYGSISRDGGATWSKNRLVYASPGGFICECCHPTVRIDSDGRILVMWRNALAGMRDMYVATSRNGGETFRVEKLGEGSWQLKACPMDGGGLAVDGKGNVVTIWRREQTVFLARAGAAEGELGKGKDGAIAVAPSGTIYTAWTTPAGVRILAGDREVMTRPGSFADLTATAAGVVAAFEHEGRIVIEPLP